MIVTLTPNPSVDRTVALDGELSRGQVHRVASVTSQAGGKGVNISRAAVTADIPSIAVVPAAKDDAFVLDRDSNTITRLTRPASGVFDGAHLALSGDGRRLAIGVSGSSDGTYWQDVAVVDLDVLVAFAEVAAAQWQAHDGDAWLRTLV